MRATYTAREQVKAAIRLAVHTRKIGDEVRAHEWMELAHLFTQAEKRLREQMRLQRRTA